MNPTIQVFSLFPTLISESLFPRELTKKEFDHFLPLQVSRSIGNNISKSKNILETEDLIDIKNFCLSSVNQYLVSVLNPMNSISIYITQSWININQKDDYHHKHTHPNSFISGVFYIETSNTDSIEFHTKNEWLFEFETKEFSHTNSFNWNYPVKKNTLLLFPSYLEHSVPINHNSTNRISLSFNTFFTGSAGDDFKCTLLTL